MARRKPRRRLIDTGGRRRHVLRMTSTHATITPTACVRVRSTRMRPESGGDRDKRRGRCLQVNCVSSGVVALCHHTRQLRRSLPEHIIRVLWRQPPAAFGAYLDQALTPCSATPPKTIYSSATDERNGQRHVGHPSHERGHASASPMGWMSSLSCTA